MSPGENVHRRPWRVATVVAACAIAVLVLWFSRLRGPQIALSDSRPAPSPQALAVGTSGTGAARGNADPGIAPAVVTRSAPGDTECAGPGASGLASAEDQTASKAPALLPVVERLRDSDGPAAQAVSLLLGDPAAWDADAWQRQRERVARAALQTQDARLYELALRACSRLRVDLPDPQDSCTLLNRDRLLQLDPGNAAAWLRKLASAITAGDEAGAADALYHAASAQRYAHWTSEAGRIVAAAMTQDPPQQRYAVWRSLSAMAQVDAHLLVTPLLAACGKARLADANRRQLCSAVDRVLLDRSDSVDTVLPGLAVGWQLGRSTEELTPYVVRNDALDQVRRAQPDLDDTDCEQAVAWARVTHAALDAGSAWAAMRAALDQAGWSAERLQQRANALDSAALAGQEPAPVPPVRPPRGHVEILGADF